MYVYKHSRPKAPPGPPGYPCLSRHFNRDLYIILNFPLFLNVFLMGPRGPQGLIKIAPGAPGIKIILTKSPPHESTWYLQGWLVFSRVDGWMDAKSFVKNRWTNRWIVPYASITKDSRNTPCGAANTRAASSLERPLMHLGNKVSVTSSN